jgi:hypothetical protein
VGNDSVVPDSKRERGVHARYALLWVLAALAVAGALAIVWVLCIYWSAAGFSSEVRAGVVTH